MGIAACLFKADLDDLLRKSLEKSIARSNADDIYAWDNTQKKLLCCGVIGPADWADLSRDHIVRPSCCVPAYVDPNTNDCATNDAVYRDKYHQVNFCSVLTAADSSYTHDLISCSFLFTQVGCLGKLKERIGSNASVLITVGITVAFIQLIGIVLACWLASSIKRETVD